MGLYRVYEGYRGIYRDYIKVYKDFTGSELPNSRKPFSGGGGRFKE